jgi:hypothetical protein
LKEPNLSSAPVAMGCFARAIAAKIIFHICLFPGKMRAHLRSGFRDNSGS